MADLAAASLRRLQGGRSRFSGCRRSSRVLASPAFAAETLIPLSGRLRYPHPADARHHSWHHRLLHRQRDRLLAGDAGRAESPRRERPSKPSATARARACSRRSSPPSRRCSSPGRRRMARASLSANLSARARRAERPGAACCASRSGSTRPPPTELTIAMQALADRGEAFNLMLTTERQRHVEADGSARAAA